MAVGFTGWGSVRVVGPRLLVSNRDLRSATRRDRAGTFVVTVGGRVRKKTGGKRKLFCKTNRVFMWKQVRPARENGQTRPDQPDQPDRAV